MSLLLWIRILKKIAITLKQHKGNKKPIIEIEKNTPEENPIIYKIKAKSSDNFEYIPLERNVLRRHMQSPRRITAFRHGYRQIPIDFSEDIREFLEPLVNITWLSIHRDSHFFSSRERTERENFESSVDKKLDHISDELRKYFSFLSSKDKENIGNFQKNSLVSRLDILDQNEVFQLLRDTSSKDKKSTLKHMFKQLGLDAEKLDKLFNEIEPILKKENAGEIIKIDDFLKLLSFYQSHKMVEDWNKFLAEQKRLMAPKEDFVQTINQFLQRKQIDIDSSGIIQIKTQSNKYIPIKSLSSGEKQLLIILGEALLQKSSPWIYIADEPELSLHIEWQEKLVASLHKINPNTQVLCATHSPDIVSAFQDKVFDMEECIS